MIELHIHLEPLASKESELETLFRDAFVPAISVQEGFRSVALLRRHDAIREYTIRLRFTSEELRVKWATSKEHDEAFPKLAAICQRVQWTNSDVVLHSGK